MTDSDILYAIEKELKVWNEATNNPLAIPSPFPEANRHFFMNVRNLMYQREKRGWRRIFK